MVGANDVKLAKVWEKLSTVSVIVSVKMNSVDVSVFEKVRLRDG